MAEYYSREELLKKGGKMTPARKALYMELKISRTRALALRRKHQKRFMMAEAEKISKEFHTQILPGEVLALLQKSVRDRRYNETKGRVKKDCSSSSSSSDDEEQARKSKKRSSKRADKKWKK